jgi:hypothetical protein
VVSFSACVNLSKNEGKYFYLGFRDGELRELNVGYSCLLFHGWTTYAIASLWTPVSHKSLFIKELSFEYNGIKYYILQNKKRKIPKMYMMENGFYVQSDAPIFPNLTFLVVGKVKDKIWEPFSDLEMHDSVEITITQIYSFDNEPLRTEEVTYRVKRVYKIELAGS